MKKLRILVFVGAVTLISSAANAVGFDGASIRYQFRIPNLNTSERTLNAIVGPGLEFNDTAHYYRVDLGGFNFTVIDTYGGRNTNTVFNGIVLSDITDSLAAITGVTFTSGGFAGERPILTFDSNNIFLNFANISQATAQGTAYSYAVTFAGGVPEPASWTMMIAGFGLVGGTLRRRKMSVGEHAAFA